MSEAKREPRPEALAYGQELKKIFLRLGKPQREVAGLLKVDPAVLSRFFSGKPSKDSAADTIAAKEHADALIRLVRNSEGTTVTVTDAEAAKLHELRRAAQEASPSQQDRVLVLQEQLDELQQQLDDAEHLEGANSRLEEQVSSLRRSVRTKQRRARREYRRHLLQEQRREHCRRPQQRQRRRRRLRLERQRERAEARAKQVEWGVEEGVARLATVESARASAQRRADQAEWEAEEYAACLASSKRQLSAATKLTKGLLKENEDLRDKVDELTERAARWAYVPVADVATQVSVGGMGARGDTRRAEERNREAAADERRAAISRAADAGRYRSVRSTADSAGFSMVPGGGAVYPPAPTPERLLRDLGGRTSKGQWNPAREHRSLRTTVREEAPPVSAFALRPYPTTGEGNGAADPLSPLDMLTRLKKEFSGHQKRVAKWKARNDFLLKLVVAFVISQNMGFLCLLCRSMLATGHLSGFRVFCAWMLGALFPFGIAIAFLLSSDKKEKRSYGMVVIVCATTAFFFGSGSLTLPWLSHSAQSLGVQSAEREDGRG